MKNCATCTGLARRTVDVYKRQDKRTLARLLCLIDEACGEGKYAAHDKVEQLSHIGGRRAVQHGEEHVLEQRYNDAVDGEMCIRDSIRRTPLTNRHFRRRPPPRTVCFFI